MSEDHTYTNDSIVPNEEHVLPEKGPLQWGRLKRELAFGTILLGTSIAGVTGPVLVPGFNIVAADLGVALADVTLLNGALIMALGVSAYICNALARVYGTRLIFFLTTILLVASCCWGAASKSYKSLLAARVFQGLGMGSWFALAGTSCINAMFPVSERGRRVGLWNFAVIVSINIAPVISARVIVQLSWRWAYWLLAISFGLILCLTVACLPEAVLVLEDTNSSQSMLERRIDCDEEHGEKHPHESSAVRLDTSVGTISSVIHPWSRMLGIDNTKMGTPHQALKELVTPVTLLINPIPVWGCLMWSVYFTWTIIQGGVANQIWSAPPYNLSATAVGNLVGIAPLIGSALGCILGGLMSDLISMTLATRNNGTFVPEHRLLVLLPAVLSIVIGAFGLGEAIQRGLSVLVTAVFLAILNFAVGVGCTGIVAYTNDACGARAGEAFGLAMVAKSAFAFGWTFALNDLYTDKGPRVFFAIFGSLTVGVTLLTIAMYIFGRRARLGIRS